MPDDTTTLDDQRLLNVIADRHRHDEELEQLRQHHEEMRRRMVLAHLSDREHLVATHRELTAVITAVRQLAEQSTGPVDPQTLLRLVADHGLCTITREHQPT